MFLTLDMSAIAIGICNDRLNSETISRTNVASVGSVFNDTRKVKVLSLPETIKEKSTFREKALRRETGKTGKMNERLVNLQS